MEVVQFVMQYNAKIKNKNLTDAEKVTLAADMLHVKKYISVREKEVFIKQIILNTVTCDNGKIKYNRFEKDLLTILTFINKYTDLNMNEKGYDLLCSNDLLEYVIGTFGKEYEVCIGIMNTFMNDLENDRLCLEDL